MTEDINWDEAVATNGFVALEVDKEKVLLLTNVQLIKRPADAKIAAGEIEFTSDVVEEDGVPVTDKQFTTTSKRLETKLRPIFEGKDATARTKLSILRVGETFQTQYSVKTLE